MLPADRSRSFLRLYGTACGAAAADGGIVTVSQSARWTDLENFQAVISVRADGLGNLSWTGNEGNEDNESPERQSCWFSI